MLLLTKGSVEADGQDQSRVAFTGSFNAIHTVPQQQRGSGISQGTQWVLLCSLGLTALAVLGHVLRGRTKMEPGRGVAARPHVPEPTAAEKCFALQGPQCVESDPAHEKSKLDGLRRRPGHAADGAEGSKPASLPLHMLIEAGDTQAVQDFVAHNSPELVEELFNMGDPALNGTTPLLLALRLGKDDISRLLLVRSMLAFGTSSLTCCYF